MVYSLSCIDCHIEHYRTSKDDFEMQRWVFILFYPNRNLVEHPCYYTSVFLSYCLLFFENGHRPSSVISRKICLFIMVIGIILDILDIEFYRCMVLGHSMVTLDVLE